jgi:tRNA A-37 threonylcarbamoyl transferase component Bud32
VQVIAAEELASDSGSEARLQPGARLGGYRLVSRLALGATAEIWLAHIIGEQGFEKAIALKTMLPDIRRAPELGATFTNEAAIAAKLYHPNIVQLVDFGRAENRYYIAMEYIEGLTLRQIALRLRDLRRPFPIPFLLHVVVKVCGALHYAHELVEAGGWLGLVHGDVSPTNLLISPAGGVKLIDFGSARLLSSPGPAPPFAGGEVRYVAPERIQGLPEDRRADVYSLGVILYECLVGAVPFEGDEISVLARIVDAPARDPREVAPDLPAELARITLRAMSRRPEERYATAEQLADDLQEFLDSQYESFRRGESEPVDVTLERLFRPDGGREISAVAIPVGQAEMLQTAEVSAGGTPVPISATAPVGHAVHAAAAPTVVGERAASVPEGDRFAPDGGGNEDVTRPAAADPAVDSEVSTAIKEQDGELPQPVAPPALVAASAGVVIEAEAVAGPRIRAPMGSPTTRPRTLAGVGNPPVGDPMSDPPSSSSAPPSPPPAVISVSPAWLFERRATQTGSTALPVEIFNRGDRDRSSSGDRAASDSPFRSESTLARSIFDSALPAAWRDTPFTAEPTLTNRAFDRDLEAGRDRSSVDVFSIRRTRGGDAPAGSAEPPPAAVARSNGSNGNTNNSTGNGDTRGAAGRRDRRKSTLPESVGCFDRGLALLADKQYLRAQAEWERACELDPGNRMYQTNLKRLRALIDGRMQGQGGTTESA